METTGHRDAVLLLVEDSPAEQRLFERALKKGAIRCELRICSDGVEALDYLYQRGAYAEPQMAPRPDLIILDLNMPRMNGTELLKVLKADAELLSIPVVVLTTSKRDEDLVESYELGCASFVSKPVDIQEFIDAVSVMGSYWLQIVTLPSSGAKL